MSKLLSVAKYLNTLYVGKPLFDGDFEAWKYGPVLTEVRSEYMTGNMFSGESERYER